MKRPGILIPCSSAYVVRAKFYENSNVEVITGSFEDAELPKATFQLVYSATAFHWIAQNVRYTKTYDLLKNDGHLAIISTNHVSDEEGDSFFFASQPIYRKYEYGGRNDDNFRLKRAVQLMPYNVDERLFAPVFFHRYPVIISYSSEAYIQLLSTYSPTISLRPDKRGGFLKEISELIDNSFGGSIKKHYSMTLTIAQKRV